jgi:low temperature requirement protein LtrA
MNSKDLIRPPLQHFAERINSFMLVVLGFSINGIALAVADAVNPRQMYYAALAGYLTVFFIKLLHFDCEVFDDKTHAMSRHQPLAWGLIWMILTASTACGISLVGAGSEAIITEIQDTDEDIDTFYTKVYVYGLSLCLFSESALRFCHTPTYEDFYCSKFLYWFQMFLQIFSGGLILYLDSSFVNSNYTINYAIMFYYGIIYGIIVVYNFIDECIENYYSTGPDVYDQFLKVEAIDS